MELSSEITATLKNWFRDIVDGIVWGDIYGDTKGRWPDSTHIHTSEVMSGPDDRGVIVTRNSKYLLEGYAA